VFVDDFKENIYGAQAVGFNDGAFQMAGGRHPAVEGDGLSANKRCLLYCDQLIKLGDRETHQDYSLSGHDGQNATCCLYKLILKHELAFGHFTILRLIYYYLLTV
jgi:hypothetical protein